MSFSAKLSAILDDIGALLEPERFEPANINTRFRIQTHNFITPRYLAAFFNKIHQLAPNLIFETSAVTEFSYRQLDLGKIDLVVSGAWLRKKWFALSIRMNHWDIENFPARKFSFYTDDMLTHAVVLKDSQLIATLPLSLAKAESEQYGHIIMSCPVELSIIPIKGIWHERSQNDQTHQWVREQLAQISSC